jgi:hypothetical protein
VSKTNRRKAALAVLAGATILGFAVAAHAALPGAASSVASGKLAALGVTVPGPNSHAGTHPDSRGNSAAAGQSASPDSQGKGSEISTLTTTTTATGVAKGALISSTASGGHSQAGTHSAGSNAGTANSGGTGTADTRSGGHSSTGTAKANTASGGRSAAGSGNASGHRP